MNEYLQLLLNGMFTGLGASLGAYVAARVFIHHLEVLEKHIKNTEEAKPK